MLMYKDFGARLDVFVDRVGVALLRLRSSLRACKTILRRGFRRGGIFYSRNMETKFVM